MIACSNIVEKKENVGYKNDIATNLRAFNDSLLNLPRIKARQSSTRGFWNRFKDGLILAAADIGGAGGGIAASKEIAGLVGVATGGTGAIVTGAVFGLVCGAGASISAYEALEVTCSDDVPYPAYNPDPNPIDPDPIDDDDEASTLDEIRDVLEDLEQGTINYIALPALPEKYQYLNIIAGLHNLIMERRYAIQAEPIEEEEEPETRSGGEESEERDPDNPDYLVCEELQSISYLNNPEYAEAIEEVLYSPALDSSYNTIISNIQESTTDGVFDYITFWNQGDLIMTENEGMIYNLYMEIYNQYPENINDVIFIANQYINAIESLSTLNDDEKMLLYLSIIISVHSAYIWGS
jgi:hypothetical protein